MSIGRLWGAALLLIQSDSRTTLSDVLSTLNLISNMLYLALAATASHPATRQFLSREIHDLTPGKMSDINVSARPREVQPYFSGYAKSIEAFLFATAVGKKVTLDSSSSFPIPENYIPSTPIPVAPVIFKMKGAPAPAVHLKKTVV
jgi:hypothetical protein